MFERVYRQRLEADITRWQAEGVISAAVATRRKMAARMAGPQKPQKRQASHPNGSGGVVRASASAPRVGIVNAPGREGGLGSGIGAPGHNPRPQ
jgi:hypothetical protein